MRGSCLVEVSCCKLPCFAGKGDVVRVVHFAQVVEAARLHATRRIVSMSVRAIPLKLGFL